MRTKMINSLALPGYHESGKAIFSDKRKPAEEAAQVLAVFHNSGGSGWWSSMDGGGRSKDPTDICTNSPCEWRGGASHCSRVMVGESEVFLGLRQETLASLDLCR